MIHATISKTLETLGWMKEARYKGPHIVCYHLYKISKKVNLQNSKVDYCLCGTESGDGE